MHLPPIIAILAFLALLLLPALDRSVGGAVQVKGTHAYAVRFARWMKE